MSSVKQPIKAAINITNSIPQEFKQIYHPYLPKYATSNTEKDQVVPTNSWISNLFYPSLNNTAPTNSDPYTIRILDTLVDGNPGLSITQQEIKETGSYQDSKSVNSTIATTMSDYLINGQTVEIRYSCEEWEKIKVSNQNNNNNITTQVISWDHFGATIRLMSQKNAKKYIDFPIARGMAYVTAHYHDLTPHFFTQRAIVHINSDGPKEDQNGNTIYHGKRFKIQFNDKEESIFIIYALDGTLSLTFAGLSRLVAKKPYNGTIRIAKIPKKEDEPIFDHYKNAWATGGLVKWKENSYAIQWKTEGQGDPLIFAYPHHIQTLTNKITSIKLSSASKGKMTAVIGNTWIMNESTVLLTDLKDRDVKDDAATWFFPQHPKLNPQIAQDILKYLEMDIESDYHNTTNKNDNYFSGKALQKYALLALILNQPNITGLYKPQLAQIALDKIKNAFSVFLQNRQMDPFFYDVIYKGIVARSGLPKSMGGTGNPGAAFGHTYYNDHHYHHGYLIVTAAIIHYLDPNWNNDKIKVWTEALIRDVNSPGNDTHFAPYRNWDWFAGHTWAGGVKLNGALDGRDQESVSESVNFFWGTKLWYSITKNKKLLSLVNMQLSIMKRTTYEYFWMLDSNKNRPSDFIKHKVTGILFEQKLDYTTYFGRNIEFIHGIQQIPMTPIMIDYFKTSAFAREEWDQVLSKVAPTLRTSWAGILYLNYVLINSSDAYEILKSTRMDDGQTRSYSLYLASAHKNT